jgi:MFS transporter, PPP family, 3-phenylpropionic acid transporter
VRRRALPAFILLYATIYAAFGVASPFWPLFFERRGVPAEQLGILLGLALMMRLIAGPLVGRLADMLGALRATLAACAAVAACMGAALLAAAGFWPLIAIEMGHAAALAPVTTLSDALALNAAKPRVPRGFEYGWVRGSASAAFIVGTLLSGWLLSVVTISAVVWMHALLLCGAVLATTLVPAINPPASRRNGSVSALGGLRVLYRMAAFRRLVPIAALIYGSHAMQDSFAVIRWNDAGIDSAVTGVLWSESVAAEVIVFVLIGPILVDRIGPRGAAALAAAAGIIRWTVMAETTAVPAMALVQPLHGLTFALLHLGCMRLIAKIMPAPLLATALALYAFGAGLATVLVTLISGVLYARIGAEAFLLMALLCALALPLSLRLRENR